MSKNVLFMVTVLGNLPGDKSWTAYQVFSENLLSLCNAKGSIADACRDIGINRQQFNKYLSGQVLPSSVNLLKICKHFDVPSHSLFNYPNKNTHSQPSETGDILDVLRGDCAGRTMAPGLYWFYYETRDPAWPLMRMLFEVRTETTGTRICGLRRISRSGKSSGGTKAVPFRGLIAKCGNRISIIYRDMTEIAKWTMVTMIANELESRLLQMGVASGVRFDNQAVGVIAAWQYIEADPKKWRKYYRLTGRINPEMIAKDPIASAIRTLFESSKLAHILAPEMGEDLLRSQLLV